MAASRYPRAGNLNTIAQFFVYGLLFLQFASVANAGKFKNICKSLNCFSKDDTIIVQAPPDPSGVICPNPKAPKDSTGWGIYKSKSKPLPTVQEIAEDLKLCGLANSDQVAHVFYSFAANKDKTTKKFVDRVKKFINSNPNLNAKSLNQIMPQSWYTALSQKYPIATSGGGMGQKAWIARNSQAFAMVATGEVYLVAQDANIYTVPWAPTFEPGQDDLRWIGPHNVWYDYEFATLQKNTAVTAIYTVNALTSAIDKSESASWVRGRTPPGENAGSDIDANTVTPESLQKQKEDFEKVNPRPDECGEASTSNQPQKRAGKNPSTSGKGKATGTVKASGGACTLKPKSTSSTSGKATGTAKPSSTSAQQSSGTTKATGKSMTSSISKPTTLATKASTTNKSKTQKPTTLATKTSATKKPATQASSKPKETKASNKKCSNGKKTC